MLESKEEPGGVEVGGCESKGPFGLAFSTYFCFEKAKR
jgi:hypothetical protein